jgi:hypothetical protein
MSSVKSISTKKVQENGKVVSKQVISNLHQTQQLYHLRNTQNIPINDFPNSAGAVSSGARIRVNIPRGSFKHCDHATLRFEITASGADATFTPVTHFFNRIDIRYSGDNTLLQSLYSDAMLVNIITALNDGQLKMMAEALGFDRKTQQLGFPDVHPQNERKTYLLPLIKSVFDSDIDWKACQNDLVIEFQCNNPVLSGSGTMQVNSCSLQIETREHHPGQPSVQDQYKNQVVYHNKYLDVVPVQRFSQTLTAGTQYLLPLDSIRGNCSHMVLHIAPAGTSDASSYFSSADVFGRNPSSTVNILSPSNEGILSDSNIPASYFINEVNTKHFKNGVLADKNGFALVLPFCDSVSASLHGTHNGCLKLSQEKNNLLIQPAVAKTNQVFTFTAPAILTSGYLQFQISGELTEPVVYNSTVAQLKASVEATKWVKSNGAVVTFSAQFDASATVTMTVNSGQTLLREDEVKFCGNCASGSNAQAGITTALTTVGALGVASGTTYDISLYCYIFKSIYQSGNSIKAITEMDY